MLTVERESLRVCVSVSERARERELVNQGSGAISRVKHCTPPPPG